MANALEAASLVMIPSGYEDGTLGSLKPIDGSGDFTFTRGTDIGATRVAEDGYIEKGYENLLLQSNTFSNAAWSSSNFTLTPNQSGYDGLNNAWKAQVSTTYNSLSQNFGGSGVYTFSGYFSKGDSNEGIRFNFSASTDTNVYVDLTDGSSTFNGTLIERSITDVGNGFYKVVVTANLTNPNSVRIFVTNGGTATIAGNIYIQDAMINQGLVAMPYLPTTTTTSVGGVLANQPRIDFTGGGCGSLLLEPSRTNVIPNSEYFASQTTWNNSGTNQYLVDDVLSPEGKYNAYKIIQDTSFGQHRIRVFFATSVSGGLYTQSVYLKRKNTDNVSLRTLNSNPQALVSFNLANGTHNGDDNWFIKDAGDGWYRCGVTTTQFTSTAIFYIYAGAGSNYIGDGVTGVYAYGAQAEQGSYPTSLIPTYGTSVTRAQELGRVGDYIGSTITFGSTDDFAILYDGEIFEREVMILGGGESQLNAGRLWIRNNEIRIDGTTPSASLMANTQEVVSLNTRFKLLVKRNGSVMDFFKDGQKLSTDQFDTDAVFVINSLFWSFNNAYICYGNHKQLTIFPTALSDAECIELTTI